MRRLAAVLLLLALAACSPLDGLDAFDALIQLQSGADPGRGESKPERRETSWPGGEGDLYQLAGAKPAAALVLVPGLAPEGRRDPRLITLADALARKRFAVLVPDLPNFAQQRVSVQDSQPVAAALRHLLGENKGPVGVAAISYAAGPGILAVLEPDLRQRVGFVVAIGGYSDSEAVTAFFTTGNFRAPGGAWRQATPNAYGKWVFVMANAERIEHAADRVALTAMARRKLADLNADIADLEAGLGREGEAVVALLANRDPEFVPALIERLPRAVRDDLAGLTLAKRDFRGVTARFHLLHGRDDAIIPYTESEALARSLPASQVRLTLLESFAHAALSPSGLLDLYRMWAALTALMAERR
ncbi:MAG: alpha/beta hydrolase [Alphaproteobacteria bacterium]|nr:alpha/beta hydrolase [Alphaproteobacteria bacterium]